MSWKGPELMTMMRIGALFACVLLACDGGGSGEQTSDAEALTRAQRDSAIAQSRLPGAGAVNRALQTSDSVAARAAAMDSIR
jgi:hypothetical protein